MKFNVEVEIDWLGEDGDLDDAVKEQVINGVVSRLEKKFVDGITREAMNRVESKIDELVTDLFQKLMEEEVTITDRWGDVVKKSVPVKTLVKDRLDAALMERVDREGRTSSYGDTTRLEFMLSKRVGKAVAEMTNNVVAQVDAKIQQTLNDAIKAKLSESLLAKVDVNGITQKALGELKDS